MDQRRTHPYFKPALPGVVEAAARHGSSIEGKAVGYVMERLLIIWYQLHRLRVRRVGPHPLF
jgi:hypothetical protein